MRLSRPRASTRELWRHARRARHPLWTFLHGYVYAAWPHDYIGAGIGERRELAWKRLLFAPFLLRALSPQKWGQEYHGKVMPTAAATRLLAVDEPVALSLPEQVIPWDTARDLVLSGDGPSVAMDCPCRLARQEPCAPLDVCLIVGEPFASFILEHQPARARAITRDEAVSIIQAEAQRGHVHHAFFKQAMLGRFYAICNCCSCCCGAISAHRHGTPMLISSGYVARVDEAACVACGTCESTCAFDTIHVNGVAQVNAVACMGCGACVNLCPAEALTLVRDEHKPAPLDVHLFDGAAALPSEMARLLG